MSPRAGSLVMLSWQVMTSEHLDADRLLRMLPSAAWLEIRALLLERFGRHNEILRCAADSCHPRIP